MPIKKNSCIIIPSTMLKYFFIHLYFDKIENDIAIYSLYNMHAYAFYLLTILLNIIKKKIQHNSTKKKKNALLPKCKIKMFIFTCQILL
ncbi:hypothetical protein, partial [Plasmodium yoelii yoelii]